MERDQVVRLMRELGICGVRRGHKVRTTHPAEAAARPPDLVERRFKPSGRTCAALAPEDLTSSGGGMRTSLARWPVGDCSSTRRSRSIASC